MAEENATTEILPSNDSNTAAVITAETVQKLSDGIIDLYKPEIENIHERVKEILRNQSVVRDSTQNELTQLQECTMLKDIVQNFDKVKMYQKKLASMKKDMNNLLERVEKTKVRAHKLQLLKEKEELEAAKEKERQRKYEKELTAKTAVEYANNSAE